MSIANLFLRSDRWSLAEGSSVPVEGTWASVSKQSRLGCPGGGLAMASLGGWLGSCSSSCDAHQALLKQGNTQNYPARLVKGAEAKRPEPATQRVFTPRDPSML